MKKVNWEIVVPVVLGAMVIIAGVVAIVNHVGMNPAHGLKLIQYNSGIAMAL